MSAPFSTLQPSRAGVDVAVRSLAQNLSDTEDHSRSGEVEKVPSHHCRDSKSGPTLALSSIFTRGGGGMQIPTPYEWGCFPEHELTLMLSWQLPGPGNTVCAVNPLGGINPTNGSPYNNELSTLSITSHCRVWPLLPTSPRFLLRRGATAVGSLMISNEEDQGIWACR
jgi:hypothetical protein